VNDRIDTAVADEALQIEAAAGVLGDPGKIEEALAEIGAFFGKNDRGGLNTPRTWDAFSAADLRDADGDFNPEAPSGALLFGLLFADDKTSSRCRYALAARVEKHLAGDIQAAVQAMVSTLEPA
jgi:hypothetical protein